MSEEIATAIGDIETVRQLRAALDVALQENDAHRVYERSLESRCDEWQATASQALRAAVLADAELRRVVVENATMRQAIEAWVATGHHFRWDRGCETCAALFAIVAPLEKEV